MVIAAILAAGSGKRMGKPLPKQYIDIGKKPILIHTVNAFLKHKGIDTVIVVVASDYYEYAINLVQKHFSGKKVELIIGGYCRNSSLKNVLFHLENTKRLNNETILLTHDAARPFVTNRIISENIDAAREYGACNTVIKAVDTILESKDGKFASCVPNREFLYQVQTPQSFNAVKLKAYMDILSDEELLSYTDACSIFIKKGEKVCLVEGDTKNIKITHPNDIKIAEIYSTEV